MGQDFSREDIAQNKTMAALGYLVFFIPLIFCKNSRLGRYCANQGLLIVIVQVLLSILFNILGIIPLLGFVFVLIGRLLSLALLVVALLLCGAAILLMRRHVYDSGTKN